MTLYETIFARRAVRKYDLSPLPDDTISTIKAHLDGIIQLSGQAARFELVNSDAVGGNKAPHYILAYCEDNPAAYINVGYCLQEMDLFIQSMNLGSLWLGMAKPKEKAADGNYCIMLAFGRTDVPLRKSETEFNRLEMSKISDIDNAVARAARLAPSAMNSQPWELKFNKDNVLIQYCGRGLLKAVLKKKLSKIDLGIITRHTEIALAHEEKIIKSVEPKIDAKNFGVLISY